MYIRQGKILLLFYLNAQRRVEQPEGANEKTMLPWKMLAKLKTFDSSISPSGLLERLDRVSSRLFFCSSIIFDINK